MILTSITLLFIFYYLMCQNHIKYEIKIIYLVLFICFSFLLRVLIPINTNKDFIGYYELYNFETPDDFFSFLTIEPYLYFIFNIFELFTKNKLEIIISIYWLNFLISLYFYIWLAFRYDIELWKKVLIFVFYYFLTCYVVLRNAPVYFIYSYFFYYSFRATRYNKIILTPLIHISSIPLLVLLLHRSKKYFKFLLSALLLFIPFFLIIILPIIKNYELLKMTIDKADTYGEGMSNVSIFHKLYFCFITGIFIINTFYIKRNIFHPLIITTFIIYYIAYFINPVIGFRYTPYIIFSILLNNFNLSHNNFSFTKILNLVVFFLLPYFIFNYFDTHYL